MLEHGPDYEVKAATVSGLGPVLVDGQGITLYIFETDHQGSPSRCYDICAIQWPPLVLPAGVAHPIAGPGIQPRPARDRSPSRRIHPDHLQRVAALSVAAGPGPGYGDRPGAHQRRRTLVRGRSVRRRGEDPAQRMTVVARAW